MKTSNIEQIILNNIISDGNLWAEVTYHNIYEIAAESRSSDSHIHSCYEVYLNITGDMSFSVENSVYPITHGDVIITKPNEFHHSIFHSDCQHEHFCLWIQSSSKISHLLSFFRERKNGEKNLISMPADEKKELIQFFSVLYRAKISNNLGEIESLYALFGILNLLMKHHENTVPSIKLPQNLFQIIKYIDNNYSGDCDIKQLTEVFFISRSTLNRQFKKHLNISPSKYIESRRISAAKELLEKGESVQNVCIKCGFNDYSHFIALFRKKFGITPYKYSKKSEFSLSDSGILCNKKSDIMIS